MIPAPTVTIGSLQVCQSCRRRKQEPGAALCPDCTFIEEMRRDNFDIARNLEDMWDDQSSGLTPTAFSNLRKHKHYRKFKDDEDLMEAYGRWRAWNRHKAERASDRRACPHCGRELDD